MKIDTEPPDIAAYRDRLESLTPRQRQILRLVHEGLYTKEIAHRWKISDDRAYKLVGQACKILGGLPRQKAAHLVALYEASLADLIETCSSEAGQPLGAQSPCLPPPSDIPSNPPANPGADARTKAEEPVGEQEAFPDARARFQLRQLIPVRTGRGTANDLNFSYTLIATAILTTAALLSAGAAASLLTTLDALVRR